MRSRSTRGSYANIQDAIDDVSSSGGGTVPINPGSYTGEGDITLKTGVRIKANGGTVNLSRLRTPTPSFSFLGTGSGDFLTGDRDISVSNSAAAGDLVRIFTTGGNPSPFRQDRRWNSLPESNDAGARGAQTFEVESATGSALTFTGTGSFYDFASGDREAIEVVTPTLGCGRGRHPMLALVQPVSDPTGDPRPLDRETVTNTSTTENHAIRVEWNSMFVQVRDMQLIQATIGAGSSENDGLSAWNGAIDCVFRDCAVFEGRHAADTSGNANHGIVIRSERHNITWDNTNSRGAPGTDAAYGIHGPSAYCVYWNCDSNFGGPAATGWRHDSRWMICGDPAAAGTGGIGMNDGGKECWFRDIRIIRPEDWFNAGEGAVSVDNYHFENITRSATPTADVHSDLNYGTAGLANTYSNVDEPSPSWIEV